MHKLRISVHMYMHYGNSAENWNCFLFNAVLQVHTTMLISTILDEVAQNRNNDDSLSCQS